MKNKFDPFTIIPEEVCEEILSYLNVRDIKEASLVTKHWYNIIGKSKSCMKKLYLKPKNSHENHEFFKSILDSSRNYQNLELIDRLNEAKSNTKYIRLMRDIVTKLAPFIVSLKMSNDLIIKVDLPKLKRLEFDALNNRSLISANGLLIKTKALETLIVRCWHLDVKSIKYLQNFLMENDSLKVVKIGDNRVFCGLNESNVKFRLEQFFTHNNNPIPFDFYKVHSDTLKVTRTMLVKDSMTFFMTNFSQLHTLSIKAYWHYNDPFDFPFNTTIRKLKFDVSAFALQNGQLGHSIAKLIRKVQNLEEVEIDFINSQILRALMNCRSLKSVKFHDCSLTSQDYDAIQIHENIQFIMY